MNRTSNNNEIGHEVGQKKIKSDRRNQIGHLGQEMGQDIGHGIGQKIGQKIGHPIGYEIVQEIGQKIGICGQEMGQTIL